MKNRILRSLINLLQQVPLLLRQSPQTVLQVVNLGDQFLDLVPMTSLPTSLTITGQAEIYFGGFINRELDYTQIFPISTNITYSCPEGDSTIHLCLAIAKHLFPYMQELINLLFQ